jgi:ferredoxin
MALMITEECIDCGACEPECPNNAISTGETGYQIDPDLCTECVGYFDEPQCRTVCPVPEVLIVNPDRRETKEELLKKKEALDNK